LPVSPEPAWAQPGPELAPPTVSSVRALAQKLGPEPELERASPGPGQALALPSELSALPRVPAQMQAPLVPPSVRNQEPARSVRESLHLECQPASERGLRSAPEAALAAAKMAKPV
jgi:hypothetical protein